jgi:hypothetical protein
MAEDKIINVGSLTSINSLVYYLSNQFLELRNDYFHGRRPKIKFDLSQIKSENISLAALAALLATGKKMRDFVGYPIPIIIDWKPKVNSFLTDCHFIAIAEKLKIFDVPVEMLGTIRLYDERLNPDTRIIYFGDVKPIDNIPIDKIGQEKAKHKQKIFGNLKLRFSSIFQDFGDEHLENLIYNTTLELIINSLMHGEEFAFVALQRSSRSITVSVCDSGIGFKRSLNRAFKYPVFKELNDAQALFIGSLIQKDVHGLRLAISETLNYGEKEENNKGWVTISSYNSEIRWEKKSWVKALDYYDNINIQTTLPVLDKVFGPPLNGFVERSLIDQGYYKTYDHFLIGTRITFEIRF